MNVKSILAHWLKEHSFDGLFSDNCDCACCPGEDFLPCEGEFGIEGCQPGYKEPCDCGDHDYHIAAKATKEENQ